MQRAVNKFLNSNKHDRAVNHILSYKWHLIFKGCWLCYSQTDIYMNGHIRHFTVMVEAGLKNFCADACCSLSCLNVYLQFLKHSTLYCDGRSWSKNFLCRSCCSLSCLNVYLHFLNLVFDNTEGATSYNSWKSQEISYLFNIELTWLPFCFQWDLQLKK